MQPPSFAFSYVLAHFHHTTRISQCINLWSFSIFFIKNVSLSKAKFRIFKTRKTAFETAFVNVYISSSKNTEVLPNILRMIFHPCKYNYTQNSRALIKRKKTFAKSFRSNLEKIKTLFILNLYNITKILYIRCMYIISVEF